MRGSANYHAGPCAPSARIATHSVSLLGQATRLSLRGDSLRRYAISDSSIPGWKAICGVYRKAVARGLATCRHVALGLAAIYSCIQDPSLLFLALTVFLRAQRFSPEHWAFCAAVSLGYLRATISQIWERLVAGEMALEFGGWVETVTSTSIRAPLKGHR